MLVVGVNIIIQHMDNFYQDLFEYNLYCNQQLAKVFNGKILTTPEKSRELFNHILNAHQIWNYRIQGKTGHCGVWEIPVQRDLLIFDRNNYLETKLILKDYEVEKEVNYKNSKGQIFKSKIKDILFHIINHSTYHRGQIALDFRKNGIEPFITDYIFYKRE